MRVTTQYHDLVLLGILFSLALGVGVATLTPLPSAVAVPAAAVIGIALIYHTLFLRGPVGTAEELSEQAAVIEVGE